MIPDDGSLHWYLHSIIGRALTPAHCIEIERRSRQMRTEIVLGENVAAAAAPTRVPQFVTVKI